MHVRSVSVVLSALTVAGLGAAVADAKRPPRPTPPPPPPPATIGYAGGFGTTDGTLMIDFASQEPRNLVDASGQGVSVTSAQIRQVRWVSTAPAGVVRSAVDNDGDGVSDPTRNPVTGNAYYHVNGMPGCQTPLGGNYTGRVDIELFDGRVLRPSSAWYLFEPVSAEADGYRIYSCWAPWAGQ